MKSFLKMTLAVIVGILIVTVFSVMVLVGAIGSAEGPVVQVPKSAVLRIDLSNTLVMEQAVQNDPVAMVRNPELRTVGLWDAVSAINAAAEDPSVKFIYLKTDGSMVSGAILQEIRKSLSNFRMSGKPVIAYMEYPTTSSYYMASVADKVFMTVHPGASSMLLGVSANMIYYKDLLDKLGVNVQLIRHGKYKSAGEPYIRSTPSEENLEQYRTMVNSVWSSFASEIAASRGISVDALNAAVDNLDLCLPEDFVAAGLVDELLTREELKSRLATFAVEDSFDDVKMVSLCDYAAARIAPASGRGRSQIAVIYADGEIVDGRDVDQVAGDRFASVISKVRADSTVKAVVLRVNSPGGSVIASDKIKAELDLLKAVKPLVASYGAYAASGGYWISGNCDKIYSDATTLTGSIGVFGMIPDFSRTLNEKVHLHSYSVTSNKHGDMFSLVRPFDSDEYAYMLRSIEDIYGRFVANVAAGRSLEADYVDSIGQGRVWTGSDALEKGLVDEIGTLEDAVRWAAAAAGEPDVAHWKITGYPKPLTTMEMLLASFSAAPMEGDEVLAGTTFAPIASVVRGWKKALEKGSGDLVFARMPYIIEVK